MPEVAGHVVYGTASTQEVSLTTVNGYQGVAFRLPVSTDEQGNPVKSISYNIEYVYRVDTPGDIGNPSGWHYSRRGVLKVNADLETSLSLNSPYVQLSDEYEFTGYDPQGTYATDLDFRAVLTNIDGTAYVDSSGYPLTLQINYASTIAGGTLVYSYVATS